MFSEAPSADSRDQSDVLKQLILRDSRLIGPIRNLVVVQDAAASRYVCRAEFDSVVKATLFVGRWGGVHIGANVYFEISGSHADRTIRTRDGNAALGT